VQVMAQKLLMSVNARGRSQAKLLLRLQTLLGCRLFLGIFPTKTTTQQPSALATAQPP